jgi:ATP-binding cassette, subfamily B (MDR/TAP), member 1
VVAKEISWFDTRSVSELQSIMTDDANLIKDAIGDKLGLFVMNVSTFLLGYLSSFIRGWLLCLPICGIFPFLAWSIRFSSRAAATRGKSSSVYSSNDAAQAALNAVKTVAAFNRQTHEMDNYARLLRDERGHSILAEAYYGLGIGLTSCFLFVINSVAFYMGGRLRDEKMINAFTGEIWEGGDVMAIFFAILLSTFALGQAFTYVKAYSQGSAAAMRFLSVINGMDSQEVYLHYARVYTRESLGDGDIICDELTFDKVNFSYPSNASTLVLRNVSFTIKQGSHVAFMGPSGSGKSSVIALIARFYIPSAGAVRLGPTNTAFLYRDDIQKLVGYVGQEPILFSMSVRENIRLGDASITDAEITEMAVSLGLDRSFLDKQCGEDGRQVSGGQKQRVALCRALVRKPKYLILDEATSALDGHTEDEIVRILENIRSETGLTLISVSHRMRAVADCDRVYVLKEGELVEQGSHEELAADPTAVVYHSITTVVEEISNIVAVEEIRLDSSIKTTSSGTKQTDSLYSQDLSENNQRTHSKKLSVVLDSLVIQPIVTRRFPRIFSFHNRTEEYLAFIPAVIGSILYGLRMPFNALLVAEAIEAFCDDSSMLSRISAVACYYLLIALVNIISSTCQFGFFGYLSAWLSLRVKASCLNALLYKDGAFHDDPKHNSASLVASYSEDAMFMSHTTGISFGKQVESLSSLAGGVIIAFSASPDIAFIMCAVTPVLVIANAIQVRMERLGSGHGVAVGMGAVSASLKHIRTIQSCSSGKFVVKNYQDSIAAHTSGFISRVCISGILYGFGSSLTFIVYAIGFYFGGNMVADGEISVADMMKAVWGITLSSLGAGQAAAVIPDLQKAKAAAKRVFAILDENLSSARLANNKITDLPNWNIKIKDVVFNYPFNPTDRTKPVLNGTRFKVADGTTVALTGTTGCGKSSLYSLLNGSYTPAFGVIQIGGVNLNDINRVWLMNKIGYIGQEPVLFPGTVRENILYGHPDVNLLDHDESCITPEIEEQLKVAAWVACIDGMLDVTVGARGSGLSGGQKQRVAIARGIVKDPKIVLLDEATSALDATTQFVVQERLQTFCKDKTTLIIAHRLSTIRNADKIVVLHKGKVAEEGTHTQLAEMTNSRYAGLLKHSA